MRKFIFTILLVGLISLGTGGRLSYAGEIDILLQKLVEKGVLTAGEAQQIGTETKEQVKAEIAAGKFSSLPAWVQNTKLKGDLRLRYQYKHEKALNDYSKDTHIGRVRVRLGLESKINEKLLTGIGIATSSGDLRSTNITFGDNNSQKNSFEKMQLTLDYAYAKYSALPWLSLVGGKMLLADVLWEPTDLIWDTDITPEGGVIRFNKALTPDASAFVNTGVLLVTADTSTNADPAIAYLVQPGVDYKFNDNLSLRGAVSLYGFSNMEGKVSSSRSGASNTGIATAGTSAYTYNYNMLNPALELKIMQPFKALGLGIETLKLFYEYVDNLDVSNKNTGYSFGFQFGNDKVEKWGDWQVRYLYAMLKKDAVLDVLPDSDRYGGKTAMRSHEAALTYGLGKNTALGVDVYRAERVGMAKAPETLVQVDWNMKF